MFKKIYSVLEWEVTIRKEVFRKTGPHLALHFQKDNANHDTGIRPLKQKRE